jgi:eukaryotic-like serine/threonine-protein kinase
VGAVGALIVQRTSVPSHPVPAGLVGRPFDELNDHVGEFGWRIDASETRKDGTEAGEILSTDPAAGERLKEGGTLHVVRSAGPTLVTVPTDLVGKTQEEAQVALTAPGIELSPQVEERPDEEVEEGLVISVGDGSAQLPKGSPIPLVVSSGPPRDVVPDVVGMPYDEAKDALEELGLDVERDVERSAQGERNEVVDVEPGEGEEVEEGGTVTLTVAQGRAFTMPDLTGMSLDEAKDALEDDGLSTGNVAGPGDGTVWGTLPLTGTPVVAGTQVQILMR